MKNKGKNFFIVFLAIGLFCGFALMCGKKKNGESLTTRAVIKIIDNNENDIPPSFSFLANSKDNEITIGNASSDGVATNITAVFPESIKNAGVLVNADDCKILGSSQTCTLKISTTSQRIPQTEFIIKGDNTNEVSTTLNVSDAIMSVTPTVLSILKNSTAKVTLVNESNIDIYNIKTSIDPLYQDCIQPNTSQQYCDNNVLKSNSECEISFQASNLVCSNNFKINIEGDNSNSIALDVNTFAGGIIASPNPLYISENKTELITITNQTADSTTITKMEIEEPDTSQCISITQNGCLNQTLEQPDKNTCQFNVTYSSTPECTSDNIQLKIQGTEVEPIFLEINLSELSFLVQDPSQGIKSGFMYVGETRVLDIKNISNLNTGTFSITSSDIACLGIEPDSGCLQENLSLDINESCELKIKGLADCTGRGKGYAEVMFEQNSSNMKFSLVKLAVKAVPLDLTSPLTETVFNADEMTIELSNRTDVDVTGIEFSSNYNCINFGDAEPSNCSDRIIANSSCQYTLKKISDNCPKDLKIKVKADNIRQLNIDKIKLPGVPIAEVFGGMIDATSGNLGTGHDHWLPIKNPTIYDLHISYHYTAEEAGGAFGNMDECDYWYLESHHQGLQCPDGKCTLPPNSDYSFKARAASASCCGLLCASGCFCNVNLKTTLTCEECNPTSTVVWIKFRYSP